MEDFFGGDGGLGDREGGRTGIYIQQDKDRPLGSQKAGAERGAASVCFGSLSGSGY